MIKISKSLILLPLLAVLSLQSCKGIKKAKGTQEQKAWKMTLQKAAEEKLEYNTLQLSGKAQLNIPKMGLNSMSVNYRVSMEQDKKIWIKVSKFIEVARILARPDSLFVLDKLGKRLMACDYSMAKDFTGLDMDFQLMQDLLLGNFNPIPDELSPGLVAEGSQAFSGSKAGSDFSYTINNATHKVTEIQAINTALKQNTKINYKDFSDKGNTLMPLGTEINMTSPDEVFVELSHRRVDINPADISFIFKVPSGYARSGCK